MAVCFRYHARLWKALKWGAYHLFRGNRCSKCTGVVAPCSYKQTGGVTRSAPKNNRESKRETPNEWRMFRWRRSRFIYLIVRFAYDAATIFLWLCTENSFRTVADNFFSLPLLRWILPTCGSNYRTPLSNATDVCFLVGQKTWN